METKVKERPITLTADEVRAVLEGLKTRTRCVLNPQPPDRVRRLIRQNDGAFVEATEGELPLTGEWECRCPYGQAGDRLWVREKWAVMDDGHGMRTVVFDELPYDGIGVEWRPADELPRTYSRAVLEIMGLRPERQNKLWQWVIDFRRVQP